MRLYTLPRIYSKNEHNIDKSLIDKEALFVIFSLRNAGHETYLVGGSVRDLLIGRKPKDFDVGTVAKPIEVKNVFNRHSIIIGKRFPIVHVRSGNKIIEVATFRKGGNTSTQLITRDISWGTPQDDACRRDFTINALFYDPEKEIIIDYVGGVDDINAGMLRTIGDPCNRFKQDPVRMIRLFKFSSIGLKIDGGTYSAISICRPHIKNSASARILDQFFMAFGYDNPVLFFENLYSSGILSIIFPNALNYFKDKELLKKFVQQVSFKFKKFKQMISKHIIISVLLLIACKHLISYDKKDKDNKKPVNSSHIQSILNGILCNSCVILPKNIYKDTLKTVTDFFYINRKKEEKLDSLKDVAKKIDIENLLIMLDLSRHIIYETKKEYNYVKFLSMKIASQE